MRSGKVLLVSVAFVAMSVSTRPMWAAEFVEYYKAGVAAAQSQEWDRVSEMMHRAIDVQPRAKARVKKGLFFKRYLPHFYLGKALYETGDCAGALASWRESESQGVVTRFPEYDQLKEGTESCAQQHSELELSFSQAKGLIASAGAAGMRARERVADLQATDIQGAEALSKRLILAESTLREAEMLLARAGGNLDDLRLSASKAADARDSYDGVGREASQWLQTIASNQVQMRVDLLRLAEEGEQALEGSEFLDPYPPGIAKRRSRVESLVDQVSGLGASAEDSETDKLASQLRQAISALRGSTVEPSRELTLAAEAFLRSDYRQVLEILGQGEPSSGKESAQTHLLQAAALFALFHSQGGVQPELLDQARREVLSCQSFDSAAPIPSPTVFSPRFIEFFEAQHATVVEESSKDIDS